MPEASLVKSRRRNRRTGQRGEAKLGCMVVALLAISLIYVFYRVGPVYLNKMSFEDDLAILARKAEADDLSSRVIERHVRELVRLRGFEARPKGIRVTRPSPLSSVREIRVEVHYRKVVEFPGYQWHKLHTFSFKSSVSSFLGSL